MMKNTKRVGTESGTTDATMTNKNLLTNNITVIETNNLYKWNKNWKRIQERFWNNEYKIRRLQQIEDFVFLNNYKKVFHDEEVFLDLDIPTTNTIDNADLILVTHQGYSRYPLDGIIEKIEYWLTYADLYLCLNRHYLNIDNNQTQENLDDNYLVAITQWLKNNLHTSVIVDLSRNYTDDGSYFTWVCPDRQYYIKKIS